MKEEGSNQKLKQHHTKSKGDIAVGMVVADLLQKGYYVFVPFATEHLPFDLIAYDNNRNCIRLQVKYSHYQDHVSLPPGTSYSDKNGNHCRKYMPEDFDYYAIYNSVHKICLYPSIKFAGRTIRILKPRNVNDKGYLWYEDFLSLNDNEKIYRDFDLVNRFSQKGIERPNSRKVDRPTKDELKKLVWQIPTQQLSKQFKVSDTAIKKWCKSYCISKPPRGYWAKQAAMAKRT